MLGKSLAICVTLVTGAVAYNASAQDCDERFTRGCQDYSRPRPPPIFPWVPFQPREFVPNSPPTSPRLLVRPGELTVAFFGGRRARYLPPFRLYLVVSLLFFASAGLLSALSPAHVPTAQEIKSAPESELGAAAVAALTTERKSEFAGGPQSARAAAAPLRAGPRRRAPGSE